MKKYVFYIMLVFGLSLGACNDWLDVPSKTEVIDYEMFETEQGFMDGMAGVYYLMADNALYGDILSMTYLDVLARRFKIFETYNVSGLGKDLDAANYYQGSEVVGAIDKIWSKGYNVIANVNSLLEQIEDYKSIFTYDNYRMIKGEALGVRAFMHFDLMRMFGKPYALAGDELTIPYVTKLSGREWPLFNTEDEVIGLALRDLQEADSLLSVDNMYSSSVENSWLNSRRSHFNRWAVYATMARIYHWKGDTENALQYARKVIESEQFRFMDPLVDCRDLQSRDVAFYTECIFTLNKTNLKDVYDKRMGFDAHGLRNDVTDIEKLYGKSSGGSTDYRFIYLWYLAATDQVGGQRYIFYRYNGGVASRGDLVTLMRWSEMYYIAAECCGNTAEGRAYLNEVLVNRGLKKVEDSISDEEFQNEILNEYKKEFFSEGHLFYYYKRLNITKVLDHDQETYVDVSTPGYVLPIPEKELELRRGITE